MQVPLSWLKEFVDIDDLPPEVLAERLTGAGLEVAAIEYIGVAGPAGSAHLVWDPATIRVGRIEAVEPHPDADRLRLVRIEWGATEPKTVVTGAPNVRPGQIVAYAGTGATVINGYSEAREHVRLEPKKLRGVLSEGMVLSERELGLADTHEGILELPADAPVGAPLQDYLGDVVITIELTPNLGRAASILGVAREVAALFDRPLREPALEVAGSGPPAREELRVQIEVPEVNPRFTASVIHDVQLAPSPAWMQRRLERAGMRPINNVVDVTNYVMLEIGQPLHAFDWDKLVARAQASGAEIPTIIMRRAKAGERLRTLDDKERALHPQDILVTDTAGILSIAGIMGGAETEVAESTTNVLLEAAAWDFISTRRSAHRHDLHSEASYRFGRGVHPAMALRGQQRGARLLAEVAAGKVSSEMLDEYPLPAPTITIRLEADDVNRLLGTALALDEIAALLRRLAFTVEQDGERLRVTVPDHRTDVTIPADLVEEVARLYGLDRLPETLLDEGLPPLRDDRARVTEEQVRDLLVGLGLTETMSYAITAPEREALLRPDPEAVGDISEEGYVALANPISQERRVMRRTLLASVLDTLGTNLRHRPRLAVFEIGLAYLPEGETDLPREERRLALALTGSTEPASWGTPTSPERDFFTLKGVVEELLRHLYLSERTQWAAGDHPTFQPGRTATLLLNGQPVGTVGELHPLVRRAHDLPEQRIALAELNLDALIGAAPVAFKVAPVPRFPAVTQDLAVVVEEGIAAGSVEEAIRAAGREGLEHVELFDVYRGAPIPEGHKSLAFSLRYTHPERTLTDTEVAPLHATITTALRHRFDARIRGEDA